MTSTGRPDSGKPAIRVRKLIVDGDLTAMDEDGQIVGFATPEQVVAWVKKRDDASARKGESTATLIEWRDMPEGFVPPEG